MVVAVQCEAEIGFVCYSALQIVREFVFRVHNGPLKITCGARSFVFRFLMGAYSIHSFH